MKEKIFAWFNKNRTNMSFMHAEPAKDYDAAVYQAADKDFVTVAMGFEELPQSLAEEAETAVQKGMSPSIDEFLKKRFGDLDIRCKRQGGPRG